MLSDAGRRCRTANDIFPVVDTHTIAEVFDLGTVPGDPEALGRDGIAVSAKAAADYHWQLGDTVDATFPAAATTLTITAIYDGSTEWMGPMFIGLDASTALADRGEANAATRSARRGALGRSTTRERTEGRLDVDHRRAIDRLERRDVDRLFAHRGHGHLVQPDRVRPVR